MKKKIKLFLLLLLLLLLLSTSAILILLYCRNRGKVKDNFSSSYPVSVCDSNSFDLTTNSTWEFYSKNKRLYVCSMYKNKSNSSNFCGVIFSINEDGSSKLDGKIQADLSNNNINIEINGVEFIAEYKETTKNKETNKYIDRMYVITPYNKLNIDELHIYCNSNSISNNCCITSSATTSDINCDHNDNLVYLSGYINNKMVNIIVDDDQTKENLYGDIYLFTTKQKIGNIEIKGKLGCFNNDYKVDININIPEDKYNYEGTFKYTSVSVKSGLNLLTLTCPDQDPAKTPMIFIRCFYEVNFDNSFTNCSITKNKSCSITKNKSNKK